MTALNPTNIQSPNSEYVPKSIANYLAGSHENALKMVLQKEIDASAIDSTVLDIELSRHPAIGDQFRVVDILGPNPIPSFVVSTSPPLELRQRVRGVLLDMHNHPEGQTILKRADMRRFEEVNDSDYDTIREMETAAKDVVFETKEV